MDNQVQELTHPVLFFWVQNWTDRAQSSFQKDHPLFVKRPSNNPLDGFQPDGRFSARLCEVFFVPIQLGPSRSWFSPVQDSYFGPGPVRFWSVDPCFGHELNYTMMILTEKIYLNWQRNRCYEIILLVCGPNCGDSFEFKRQRFSRF